MKVFYLQNSHTTALHICWHKMTMKTEVFKTAVSVRHGNTKLSKLNKIYTGNMIRKITVVNIIVKLVDITIGIIV